MISAVYLGINPRGKSRFESAAVNEKETVANRSNYILTLSASADLPNDAER
jgi:hypothetical protein